MGIYLNNTSAYSLYREDFLLTYFVDKTDILNELVPLLESKSKSADTSPNKELMDQFASMVRQKSAI